MNEAYNRRGIRGRPRRRIALPGVLGGGLVAWLALALTACSNGRTSKVEAKTHAAVTLGVTKVVMKTLSRDITLSFELVPLPGD